MSTDNCYYRCRVCADDGEQVCKQCKVARYCSKDCQRTDWKNGHKQECGPCMTVGLRAVHVTATIDLRRILPPDAFREGDLCFYTAYFLLRAAADCCGIVQMFGGLTKTHDVSTLQHVVTSGFDIVFKQLGAKFPSKVFTYPRGDSADLDLGMPLGVPHAVTTWHADTVALFQAAPVGSTLATVKSVMDRQLKAVWTGTPATCTPTTPEHAAEAQMYDSAFTEGITRITPCLEVVPHDSLLTLLHFSNGFFYKRVDFVACRKGLAPDRILAMSPRPMVFDCRAIRKHGGGTAPLTAKMYETDDPAGQEAIRKAMRVPKNG